MSPPHIPAPGLGCRCVAGRVARCLGASLSIAAGAHHRRLSPRRGHRHPGAPDGSMAVGAPRPAIHRRESSGRQRQHRHRGGRQGACRWLHAAADRDAEYDQCRALHQSQLRLHPGYRTRHRRRAAVIRGRGESVGPRRDASRVHRVRQGQPGKINYGSAGQGTPQNIACELFKMMTGLNLVHVPYKGGAPAVADLIAGHVQVVFAPVSEAISHIKAGKLRALAVTTAARLDALPDLPTVGDFVTGYEASGFAGIGAPRNTPPEIIALLNKELNAGLADSRTKARIVELGGTVLGGTPAEFGAILSEATAKWARVIRFAGIKAD